MESKGKIALLDIDLIEKKYLADVRAGNYKDDINLLTAFILKHFLFKINEIIQELNHGK